MRAKNEAKFLAAAYKTKLILERVVDGTLMCPEACCGAPVMECKCGPDCPHCNCHEIQKLSKKDKTIKEYHEVEDAEEPRHLSALKRMQRDIMNGMTAKESMEGMKIHPSHMRDLLEEYLKWSEEWSEGPIETGFEDDPESSYDIEKRLGGGRFDHPGKTSNSASPRVRLTRDSPGTSSVHLPEDDPRIQKYLDLGYKIVKDYKKAEQSEDTEDIFPNSEYGDHLRRAAKQHEQEDKETDREATDREASDRKEKQATTWERRKARWEAWKKKQARSEDNEGWGRVAQGALIGSLLGKGAVTGGLAGAAYHALKGDTPKKKEKKKKRGSWSGANYEDAEEFDGPGMQWDGIDDPYTTLDATVRDFEQELDIQGDGIDTNVNELKDYIDIIKGLKVSEIQKKSALKYLSELKGPGGRAGLEDVDYNFVFGIAEDAEDRDRRHHPHYGEPEYDEERSERLREDPPITSAPGNTSFPDLTDLAKRLDKQIKHDQNKSERSKRFDRRIDQIKRDYRGEDNEEPKRVISGHTHRPSGFGGKITKSEDIDKIDLSKWKEYPAEDVMKAVYRQYGKELPSVDSRDWEMSWDKKVRPWLKSKFPDA